MLFGDEWFADLAVSFGAGALFAWMFAAMLWCAFGVVRHADCLAEHLGEPYGTLILTLSVIGIEVTLIVAIMLTGDANPTLARDTMFAILMIVLNGMVGIVLLIGGLRHLEQDYNLRGARAFLGVILPLSVIALVLPVFTRSTPDPSLTVVQAVAFAGVTALLYGVFLAMQTVRHRSYFLQPSSDRSDASGGLATEPESDGAYEGRSIPYHGVFLVLTMLPIVLLSKKLGIMVDFGISSLSAPAALSGILVAVVVLTPEALAAIYAARADRLQRSVNICLGSALSTIGLTVPAVVVISIITGKQLVLGLDPADLVLLMLTLLSSIMTFGGVRTNVLQGAVHLVLFVVYIVLVFSP
ncbi:MAG: calcium:proton antiporter [Pseudomonadota bacterium]